MNRRSRSPVFNREESFSMSSLSSLDDINSARYGNRQSRFGRDRRYSRDGRYSKERDRTRGKESDRSKGKEQSRRSQKDSGKYKKNDKYRQSPEEDSYLKNIPGLQKAEIRGTMDKDSSVNKQADMEEYMLDPSTCNFQVSFQSMEDNVAPAVEESKKPLAEKNSKDEGHNRLDRLEKLVEMLVTNTSKPQPSPISAPQENWSSNIGVFELIPRNTKFTTSMWLNKIQEACIERNLDEKTTIQFMQSKMTGILKAWFKTVSAYDFTWPELKMLIIKTFPDNSDFATTLRLLVDRRKMPDEYMTQYYFSKMYLLEACKIMGANAVSCIIDGLEGDQLRQEAKSGNYLTPEALYSQFLSTIAEYQNQTAEPKYQEQEVTEVVEYHEPYNPEQNHVAPEVDYRTMRKRSKKKCYTCNKVGHITADCRHAPYCYKCKQKGHIVMNCPLTLRKGNNNYGDHNM